jgi:uncharacterized YigZ family protein
MYRTIKAPSEGIYRESGSRFLSFAYPIAEESQVKELLHNLQTEHKGAVHYCYAYVLGEAMQIQKSSDDGEPAGSAGKPILNQILSMGITNVLLVVVRYYGGIKLGIPGLIRAYKTSAADALAGADIIEKQPTVFMRVNFRYEFQGEVMRVLKHFKVKVLSINNNDKILIEFEVEKQVSEKLVAALLLEQHKSGLEFLESNEIKKPQN